MTVPTKNHWRMEVEWVDSTLEQRWVCSVDPEHGEESE